MIVSNKPADVRVYFFVYLALMVLLVLTVAVAERDLGHWNFAVTMSIAGTKAILIALFFMHVWQGSRLVKLVIAAGLLWLAIMFSLSLSDYWTRSWDLIIRGSDDVVRPNSVR
jgi:cytochrome c oxidase subunit 4